MIKAWADGALIECLVQPSNTWELRVQPTWSIDATYRIKPEPKPDMVYYGVFSTTQTRVHPFEMDSCFTKFHDEGDQVKVTFDGETGKLKSAEVL